MLARIYPDGAGKSPPAHIVPAWGLQNLPRRFFRLSHQSFTARGQVNLSRLHPGGSAKKSAIRSKITSTSILLMELCGMHGLKNSTRSFTPPFDVISE